MIDKNPSFSIIIEFSNYQFIDFERANLMLTALKNQLTSHNDFSKNEFSLVVLYNKDTFDFERIRLSIQALFPSDENKVSIIETENISYYEMKNLGAIEFQSEIKIFIDCDAIPNKNWIKNILIKFNDENVSVVAGKTYIQPKNLYQKIFSRFWIFEPNEMTSNSSYAPRFHANNVAFRTKIFNEYNFPEINLFRGQCTYLSNIFSQANIKIHYQPQALVEHPAPEGFFYFLFRAYHKGRDTQIINYFFWPSERSSFGYIFKTLVRNISTAFKKLTYSNDQLEKLSKYEIFFGMLVAINYYLLQFFGSTVTLISPKLASKIFKLR